MNNRYRYIWSLALAAAALSCQKDDLDTAVETLSDGIPVEISLSTDSSTRVTIDDLDVDWGTGDKMLFYNTYSLSTDATSYASLSVSSVDGNVAKFSGNLPAALGGGNVSGFYPASGVILNKGALDPYSQLRIVQPGYILYDYTDGKITPASMANYCYLSFVSNELLLTTSETEATVLSGTANHVLAYMDLNLKNPTSAVKRVYISMSEPLVYEAMMINTNSTTALDKKLNYCESTTGDSAFDDYLSFQLDYMVVEMNSAAGAAANSTTSELQVRLPFIPQTLSGTWTVIVEYADNDDQSMFTVEMDSSVAMEAGVVYNYGKSYDLTNATTLSGTERLPKMGDLVDANGNFGTTKSNMSNATPVGIVYDVAGIGEDLKVASAYRLTTTNYKVLNAAYANDYANTTSMIRNAHFTGTYTISNGFDLMQAYIDIVNDEDLDSDTLYENTLISLREGGYTNEYILSQISPAYSAAWAQNTHTTDRPASPYTGEERGWWYLPSLGEVYHLIYQTQMLQSHGTFFFSARETEIKAADSVTATTIIPTTSAVTNILTAATWETIGGGVWGVAYAKNYNLYNLTPITEGSTDSAYAGRTYISAGCSKYVTTQTYAMRTIINY